MCNPNVPSVVLATAVLMQVQEFVNSAQSFSRYDITRALRQKCNDGLLEIPEVEDVNTSNPAYRYNIRKSDVDAIFDQLFQNCLSNGLPPLKVVYDRNLGYRVFSADQPSPAPSVNIAPPATFTPPPVPVVSNPPVVSYSGQGIFSKPGVSDPEIRRRISLYVDGYSNTWGVNPTPKQVQSAIKRGNRSTGFSCNEIKNVMTSLGY